MDAITEHLVLSLGSLLAVLNPLATVPPFVAMTEGNDKEERVAMARRASMIACVVLLVFTFAGPRLLGFFGVSMAAFQIAGGLVLIRVAFELLQGGRSLRVTPEESQEGVEKDDISVTPLAVPILCGPATIATAILLSTEATTWLHRALLATIIITIYGATFGLLTAASKHSRYLGATTIKVSSRLMGLVLVAVAVEFVLQGLNQSLFKTV